MSACATSLQPTYSIPISNGIFAHCKKMGSAVWVFLWLVDHTTKEAEGAEGQLEGLVLGGMQVRASLIAKDLEIATRTVHEHIERLCDNGYVRRIDGGDGMPAGYAVQKSKKWKKNTIHQVPNLADNREPSQESANLPRGITVDPRGNPLYPRGNPLPIRKTVQDSTEHKTPEAVLSGESKTTKTKNPVRTVAADEIDRVYQAYPLKKEPGAARIAISKAFDRLTQRGESDPATFLIGRIEVMKAARDRDNAKGAFVPPYKYPATWFNKECYDEPGLEPVKNCVLPGGILGTEAELQAQTGWAVMRGVA
jgi:hypothetical protein